jgi:hypothetical protein
MPRVMLVVLGLGVLVWGLAFFDFGKPRTRSKSVATHEAEPTAETGPGPAPAHTTSTAARAPVRATPPKPLGATTGGPTLLPRPPGGAPAAEQEQHVALRRPSTPAAEPEPPAAPTRGALSTATGELGEGIMSPEYTEMERSYAHEPRDGAWADGEEQRLRAVLGSSPLASTVGLVNCQESMCRVLLESDDYDVYSRLLAIPGFRELTGLGPGSAYSHRSGQLSVYFPRRASDQAQR